LLIHKDLCIFASLRNQEALENYPYLLTFISNMQIYVNPTL